MKTRNVRRVWDALVFAVLIAAIGISLSDMIQVGISHAQQERPTRWEWQSRLAKIADNDPYLLLRRIAIYITQEQADAIEADPVLFPPPSLLEKRAKVRDAIEVMTAPEDADARAALVTRRDELDADVAAELAAAEALDAPALPE